MTSTPRPGAPPRWSERMLRACLPNDSMRDAIIGDLHEELVRDTTQVGADRARSAYRQRVAGIVAYVVLDIARSRPWGSTPVVAAVRVPRTTAARRRARIVRGDMGVFAAAFGVLVAGIVVNTLLFSVSRHGQPAATPALGIAALLLALGSAGGAAVLLCVGPRWLRRRVCRDAREIEVRHS